MIRPSISKKLVSGVGFSKGCALFWPKKPPPLVPRCLMAICEAAGPVGISWVVTCWSTITGTFVIITLPWASFWGTSTITGAPLDRTAWPWASSCGAEAVTAILVMTGWPLSSVFGTWAV